MAFILAKPNSSSAEIQSVSDSGIILPSSTVITDSLDISLGSTIKWIVELSDYTNKINSFEILATKKFNNDVSYNKYSISGDKILHDLNISIDISNMQLEITNNELVNIGYSFLRFII